MIYLSAYVKYHKICLGQYISVAMWIKSRFYKGLRLGLTGISSCISVFLITNQTLAQQSNIIPDNTLGGENSRLNRNVIINGINADTIDGGATRNSNLFHSFSEFNIDNRQSVYFINPNGVENILTRVTGKNASNIFGTLGVDGAANLFLINPSGIVFGENASLDLQGSFVGTTASGLQFGEQGNFSATNPELPGNLTVNPSALFFNQVQASGGIINKSQIGAGLRVPDGKSLLLVGGDINLDGGSLTAYEGNIELASFTVPGTVGLTISGNTFSLNIPEEIERGDISLTNQSLISIFGAGGGNLTINARNLEISNSFVFAGIGFNLENPDAQAGDVNLNATDSIEIKNDAFIDNSVYTQGNAGNININALDNVTFDNFSSVISNVSSGAVGKGGNIEITTGTLSVSNVAAISATTSGQGDAGNININARDKVIFSDLGNADTTSLDYAVGNGGDIRIKTGELLLKNGGFLSSLNSGAGNAGNIFLDVRDTITFDGVASSGFVSRAGTFATNGNAGNIDIKTGSLFLTNSGQIDTAALGQENADNITNAGNITINARDIKIDGDNSGLFTELSSGKGKAGDIEIATNSLSVTNGAYLFSLTNGQGNAGNMTINARDRITFDERSFAFTSVDTKAIGNGGNIQITTGSLSINNGSQINSDSFGKGDAGKIELNATESISSNSGFILSTVNAAGEGKGGSININTQNLALTNGSQINASLFGKGRGGEININASESVDLSSSGILTSTQTGASGDAGNITLTTGNFNLKDDAIITARTFNNGNAGNITFNANTFEAKNGGQVNTTTFSSGNAGTINLNIKDRIILTGSKQVFTGLFASTSPESTGKGGSIFINPRLLIIENGAGVSVGTSGKGDAGNVEMNATELISLSNSGFIDSNVNQGSEGNGGEIKLNASNADLNNNGRITVSTFGKGDAGKIELNATELILLSNSGLIDSNIGFGGEGKGGFIDINTKALTLTDGSRITSSVFGKGKGGEVNIKASESVDLSSSGIFTSTEAGASGDAGNITVTTDNFGITDAAIVNATTFNDGKAGNITFNANTFEATNGGRVATATDSSGNAGTIKLFVKDKITFVGGNEQGLFTGLFASTSAESSGKGGSIFIDPRLVIIENGAGVSVGSFGKGDAGDISLQAGTLQLNNGFIEAQTASTQGGDINLQISELLLLRNESQISTTAGTAQAGGNGGNININSKFIVAPQSENSDITANAFSGNGGKVNINSSGIFGIETQQSLTEQSDITASSQLGISGETNINTDDTSSIQNSFTELSPNIDTNAIIASSCIARSNKRQENSFKITGGGALPSNRPGNVFVSNYTTGEVRTVETEPPVWKKGDPIIEPQGLYRLSNGELLLSRECSK